MGTRTLRPKHQEDIRRKIQASQIINRLEKHVLGKVKMTPTQVQAAKVLLDKAVSNAPTEHDVAPNSDLSQALHSLFDAAKGGNGIAGLVRRKA